MEAINLIEKFQDRKEEFLSKLENKNYFTKNNDTNKNSKQVKLLNSMVE